MAKFIEINGSTYSLKYYLNPDHIESIWWEQDGGTRIKLTSGSILYCKETPEELLLLISEARRAR